MDLETIRLRSGLSSLSTTPFIEESADTSLNGDGGLANKHVHANYGHDGPPQRTSLEEASTKSKEHSLRARTKEKAKSLLHIHHNQMPVVVEDDQDKHRVLSNIDDDPAFHPTKVVEEAERRHQEPMGTMEKTRHNLQSMARAVAHPRQTAQSKAHKKTAAQLSWMQGPQLSDLADVEYLEAHEATPHLGGMKHNEGDADANNHSNRERVKVLEEHKDRLLVAWTTRHIDRVAAIRKLQIKWPDDPEAFVQRDETGNILRWRWEKYLGYTILWYTQNFSAQYIDDFDELPFDIDQLRDHVERIVMASSPWQAWAMEVRSIYRWEKPWKTAKWLAIYTVIWYYQFMVGFVYSYVLYLVIRNRYFPSSVHALQESLKRSKDLDGVAYRFGELVEKYGREDWIEPLVGEMGPYLQLQLNDIANILEVFTNFYAWKYPRKTMASLFFVASCLLISIFTDMIFCLKIFWFIAGGGFFVTFPISSYFPKYRLLVSPIKWVLWDVPTNAEWSFAYLRHQAQIVREKLISRKVEEVLEDERIHPPLPAYAGHLTVFSTNEAPEPNDYDHELYDTDNYDHELYDTDNSDTESFHSAMSTSSILSSTDILAYRAQYRGAKGKFIIHSAGVRFAPSRTSSLENHSFNLPYHDISEMCKIDGAASKLGKVSGSAIVSKISKASGGSGQQLEFRCADSTNLLLDMAEDRDEAFNAVLGFSGVRWQSLQTGPRRQGNGRASGDGKSGGGKRSLWGEKGVMGLA